MQRSENCSGEEKVKADKECLEAILLLWKHRASLSVPKRPLESFEPIFELLSRLSDDNRFFYFERSNQRQSSESEEWIELAAGIDYAALDLIRWCIGMACSKAVEDDGEWAVNMTARTLDDGPDLRVARLLFRYAGLALVFEGQEGEHEKARLIAMRDRLDTMVSLSTRLRDRIDLALSQISNDAQSP